MKSDLQRVLESEGWVDESWKTEFICDYLEERGHYVNYSDLSEPVIEFLMGEIGLESYMYVSVRYGLEPLTAKAMIRDMLKAEKLMEDKNV